MDQSFFEAEALEAVIVSSVDRLQLKINPEEILNRLDDEQKAELNRLFVELFEGQPNASISDEIGAGGQARLFALRLHRSGGDAPNKMRFFKVKSAWNTLAINLVGFVISIAALQPSAVVPALNIVKSVYDNLVTLKSPDDDVAMKLFESLIKLRAVAATELGNSNSAISAAKLINELGVSKDDVFIALGRLKELGLIEPEWAALVGDIKNPGNNWKPIF
jgi:hypothetical protein